MNPAVVTMGAASGVHTRTNLPADLPHFSGCAPGVDCLLFQYQSYQFDLVPTATP
ncbi:hypothetical protein [Nocardia sp. NPDC127526]|uniref:hypothetical protein n=1 Tax=Nocardia sp. NPDC127526 TaxID=3345393 RepID=UPI0036313869